MSPLPGDAERLALRARRGDRLARAALVERHMGLVRSIARRYRHLGVPLDDLVQEGAIGLLDAVDHYEPDRGAAFSTYAFWRVRAAVSHAAEAEAGLVRIPRPVRRRRRLLAAEHERLSAKGRTPTSTDLAAATGLDLAAIAEALAPLHVVPLDDLADDGSVTNDARAEASEQRRSLARALGALQPRQRTIVRRHFGIGGDAEPLTAIAADLRLSPERTRAIKDDALRALEAELDP